MKLTFDNNGKDPNALHGYLIANGCTPTVLSHNAVYATDEGKKEEATEITIDIEEEKKLLCESLVALFMS